MANNIIPALLAAILASGCTTFGKRGGAEFFDETLEQAEWVICEAASIGSIQRRYRTESEYAAWQGLCQARATRDAGIARERNGR